LGEVHADLTAITLGQNGCWLHSASGEAGIPAPKVRAVAAGGAGDVFAGTFIAEWLSTGNPEHAAHLAVAAASDKATRHGTLSAFPDRSTIEAFRRNLHKTPS
jgi:2-dehydro-3-deoxygluconokinase